MSITKHLAMMRYTQGGREELAHAPRVTGALEFIMAARVNLVILLGAHATVLHNILCIMLAARENVVGRGRQCAGTA